MGPIGIPLGMIEPVAPPVRVRRPRSIRRGLVSFLLGALVSGAAIALVLSGVNLAETAEVLRAGHPLWIALAFLAQLAATAGTLRRWQVMLRPYPARFAGLARVYFIAHLLNTVLPAKIGTVARVLLAAEGEKINTGFVFGSVAVEKILDTAVMLLLLVAVAPWVPLPAWLREPIALSAGLLLLALAALVAVRQLRDKIAGEVARVERRLFGPGANRWTRLIGGALDNLVRLTGRRQAGAVLFWTLPTWIAAGLANLLLFLALDIHVDWSAMWFLLVVLQIGTRVPALPANIGVFHYLVVLTLGLYGVDPARALGLALLLHLVVFILPAVIGAALTLPAAERVSRVVWSRDER